MISKNDPAYRESSEQTSSEWSASGIQERRGKCGPLSWSILPIVLSITSAIGFTTTYFFAKSNCHIQKWILPYLSYTGTEYPESMVFGMILNTEGFLGLTVVFLGWRYYRHMGQRGWLNRVTLICGGLSCFGVIMVGNFQVTKAKIPHYFGAGLAFIVGTAYGILTSIISRRAYQVAEPRLKFGTSMAVIRSVLAIVMVIALTCLTGVGMYKKLGAHNSSDVLDDTAHVYPNGSCQEMLSKVKPYVRYIDLLGSLTEWILTACLLVCLSLFAYEFQTFQKVKVVLLRHDGPLRCSEYSFGGETSSKSPFIASNASTPTKDFFPGALVYTRAKRGNQRFQNCDPHCEFGGRNMNSPTSIDATPLQPHNAMADSGIEDNTPQTEGSSIITSVDGRTVLYLPQAKITRSRSMPNMDKGVQKTYPKN